MWFDDPMRAPSRAGERTFYEYDGREKADRVVATLVVAMAFMSLLCTATLLCASMGG